MSLESPENTGVWIVGATGGLGTTVMAGARLLARGLADDGGLVTALPVFRRLPFVRIEDLRFGGHEIRQPDLRASALAISQQNGSLPRHLLPEIDADLAAIDADIRVGTAFNCGATIRRLGIPRSRRQPARALDLVQSIQADFVAFQAKHRLKRLVVVNLASTEPPLPLGEEHRSPASLRRLLERGGAAQVRASLLYAYAAVEAGHGFVNFTASNAALVPGIVRLAEERGVPVVGSDGKTGETLVKSVLAPLFLHRNLRVLSWQGYNILGDGDGQVLADAANKSSKVQSKDSVLSQILGYPLHTHVGIDYVPSLGDLKTAWDFVHFQGFLGFKMALQFIWQGCDAILAAPLVLDLIRFTALAQARSEGGVLTHLASFFKSPLHGEEQDFAGQYQRLLDYAASR